MVLGLPVSGARLQVFRGAAQLRLTDAYHFLATSCPPPTPRGGFLLAGSLLTVPCAESARAPVVATGRVVTRAPRGSVWFGGSGPDRNRALAGAPRLTDPLRSWGGKGLSWPRDED